MAKYSDIKGFTVQTVSSDPVASLTLTGSWTSGGNLPQALYENNGAGATQSASMNFGGQGNPPGPAHPYSADTQLYNGSSWTEVNNLNNGRRLLGGSGTQTSALAYGGYTTPPSAPGTKNFVESWDGTNWTEVAELNTKRRDIAGIGTASTNAVCVAGHEGTAISTAVEQWNGSAWTETTELSTQRYGSASTGSSTAGVVVSGETPPGPFVGNTEQWDGSAWTEIADINTARRSFSGGGTYTEILVAGGTNPSNVANTEYYDGSSWTEVSDLSAAKYINYGSSGHTSAQTMVFGGSIGSRTDATEEWTTSSTFSKITEGQLYFNSTTNTFKETVFDIPGATWASGAAMNTQRAQVASAQASPHSAGQVAGGAYTNVVGNTEQYNGTAWTEVNDLNTANRQNAGSGTQTSAISSGGYNPSWLDVAETWNGSSWTEVSEINQARYQMGAAGVSNTSAMIYSGEGAPSSTQYAKTETWDGSSWTEVNDMNQARYGLAGGGTLTDAIGIGGQETGAGNPSNKVELWDGTSWTETTEINTSRGYSGAGVSNGSLAIFFAGATNPNLPGNLKAQTEFWNGSSWTEVADLGTARFGVSGQGTAFDALSAGGGPSTSGGTATEEWTTPLANKTITAS